MLTHIYKKFAKLKIIIFFISEINSLQIPYSYSYKRAIFCYQKPSVSKVYRDSNRNSSSKNQKTLVLLCNKDDQKPFASQHFSIKKEATLKKDCSKWILLQQI